MEFAKKYWYVIVGAVLLMLVVGRSKGGSPGSVTQIGGGAEGLAYAQLDAQTEQANTATKFGFIGNLLSFDLQKDATGRADALERLRIASGERVSIRQAETGQFIAAQQTAANQAALNAANYQAQLQANLQQQVIRGQQSSQTWSNILGSIFGGFDRIAPLIFGNGRNNSGGGSSGGTGGIFGNFGGWGGF